MQNYLAGYVPALENHAAMLGRTLNERVPGLAQDHLDNVWTQFLGSPVPAMHNFDSQPPSRLDDQVGTSPESERLWQWQPPQTSAQLHSLMDAPIQLNNAWGHQASPPDFAARVISSAPRLTQSMHLPFQGMSARSERVDDIPTATAASFFRIYFQFIHPQYPFLSLEECGNWYTE